MNFRASESVTKLRGGYYTPAPIASFLARWVLTNNPLKVLEPSCGDGAFIRELHSRYRHSIDLTALEIVPEEAAKARHAAVQCSALRPNIIVGDFLAWALEHFHKGPSFDAVLGNPPYIRYQYLNKKDQELAERIFTTFKLGFTKHTNAWVPFVVASVALLRPGGRLAMVIPSEILHILHAGSLRRFLLEQCDRVLLIDPNELLFSEALQGTVLLMAQKRETGASVSQGVSILRAPNNSFLENDPEKYFSSAPYVSDKRLNGKWMKVLLDEKELLALETVRDFPGVHQFGQLASVDVGIVTGANKFFLVDDKTVERYGLQKWVRPMFGRSDHCSGIIYDRAQHCGNQRRGLPTNFVLLGDTPRTTLPSSIRRYIRFGETQNLQTRYKCRIREPWYNVPSVYGTQVAMLKRANNFPRLILNTFGALTTDTAYRIRPLGVTARQLVGTFVNSLTALTAELEGRHYGGGVLELVPSEIEKLLVPIANDSRIDLRRLHQRMSQNMPAASLLAEQDDIILKDIGVPKGTRQTLHSAWQRIRSRRQRLILTSPVADNENDE